MYRIVLVIGMVCSRYVSVVLFLIFWCVCVCVRLCGFYIMLIGSEVLVWLVPLCTVNVIAYLYGLSLPLSPFLYDYLTDLDPCSLCLSL